MARRWKGDKKAYTANEALDRVGLLAASCKSGGRAWGAVSSVGPAPHTLVEVMKDLPVPGAADALRRPESARVSRVIRHGTQSPSCAMLTVLWPKAMMP